MAHASSRLPPELLLECLRAADPATRVRASHVSRRWRTIALSDSRLWDSFSCSHFRDGRHQEAMLDKLEAMLVRSRSRPFRLRIPHYFHDRVSTQCHPLLALEQLDIGRLVSYDGPSSLFSDLILDETPLPTLTSLKVIESEYSWGTPALALADSFSGHGCPNLMTLQAGFVTFSPERYSCLFPAMEHLECSLYNANDIVLLFEVFPNVVSLKINNIEPTAPFPAVLLPPSLHTVVLCPFGSSGLYLSWKLQHWVGAPIPRLVVPTSCTARGVLALFLAIHPHPVDLRLNSWDGEIVLSTPADEFTWTIIPSPQFRDTFLLELETHNCDRLISISVALEQLGRLFAAQLHLPGLERLGFRLDGVQEAPLLRANDYGFFIRAPRLKQVVFILAERADAIGAGMEEAHAVLALLRISFRTLIFYDAELLDSVTLSGPAACVEAIDCAGFACFAKDYRICRRDKTTTHLDYAVIVSDAA